jgi:cellulose synthase operon protein C
VFRFRRPSSLLLGALLTIGAAPRSPDPSSPTPQTMIAQSRAALEQGDFSGAFRVAEAAAAKFPSSADAVLLAANLVRDRYGLTASIPWFDRVVQLDPDNVSARLDKAAALGDSGRTVEMLAVTREVLARDPKNALAFIFQSMMAARAGQWDLARSLYEHSRGRFDGIPSVMLLRGAIGIETGGTEGAIAALRGLVDAQPGNRPARRLLALALWRAKDAQGTIDTLKPISDDGDGWAQLMMARACESTGDRLCAAILIDRAAAGARASGGGNGGSVASLTGSANIRFTPQTAFRLIDALNRSGNVKAAETVTATLVEQFPASLPVLRLAASDALARREWGRAATALQLLRLRGGDGDAQLLSDLAWAKAGLGTLADARDLSARAYALAPFRASIAASAGWFAALAGDRPRGILLLEKSVAMAPGYAPYAAKLAEVRRR